jgi:HK97 family phage major capsid protein
VITFRKMGRQIGDNLEVFTADHGKSVANLKDRIERIEALNDRPNIGTSGDRPSEVKTAIERFFRKGDKSGLAPYQAGFDEKAMSISSDSSGGYTHIPELGPEILAAIGEVGPLRAVHATRPPRRVIPTRQNARLACSSGWLSVPIHPFRVSPTAAWSSCRRRCP